MQHGDRALLFPPWKFDIRGPLTLLDILSRRGHLCVLGAVDNQVFWELLAQLLEADDYRPENQVFTSENLPTIFGDVYQRLTALAIGDCIDLSLCGTLRQRIPRALPDQSSARFTLPLPLCHHSPRRDVSKHAGQQHGQALP